MSYILFSFPDCASHVVRMALEEFGAPYRDEVVDMHLGAHQSPEFLRLNPRGMVPVLADERSGVTLSETGAILQYLAEQEGDLAPAISDGPRRASFLKALYFLSNTLHADAQIQYYTERYVGESQADSVRPLIKERMRSHFKILDRQIGDTGGPWMLGANLSVCDFYLAGCVRWSLIAPHHDPLEPDAVISLPNLKELLERLQERESVIRAFAAEDTPKSAFFLAPVRSRKTRNAGNMPWDAS